MKTAISIPETVFVAAERLEKQLGISRSELYAKAVKAFLAQNNQVGITEKLNAVYGSDDSERLDPVLHQMQLKSIGDEQW